MYIYIHKQASYEMHLSLLSSFTLFYFGNNVRKNAHKHCHTETKWINYRVGFGKMKQYPE